MEFELKDESINFIRLEKDGIGVEYTGIGVFWAVKSPQSYNVTEHEFWDV